MKHRRLTDEERRRLINETHAAAWELAGDIEYLRKMIGGTPDSGEVKRMSAVLRRLLIDGGSGELTRIASARLSGRLLLLAPNDKKLMSEKRDYFFASIGRSNLFGMTHQVISFREKNTAVPFIGFPEKRATLYGIDSEEAPLIAISLDRFLRQAVLFYYGAWISRRDVIAYVANVAGGVHSGEVDGPTQAGLENIRRYGAYFPAEGGGGKFRIFTNAFWADLPKTVDASRLGVDLVLAQLLIAAYHILNSPDVIELERIINTERNSRVTT